MQFFSTKARWVVPPDSERNGKPESNEWFMCRTGLMVSDPAAAVLRIAVDSKYWLYVNGKLIVREGGLKRGPVPTGSYYDEVDISKVVHAGNNTVALLLWYFGRHGFSHRDSGMPGLLVDTDCGDLGDWKIKKHPAYFDAGYIRDAFRLSENSIGFDARYDFPEWPEAGFADSDWPSAIPSAKVGSEPWGMLEKREFSQWFWSDLKEYESVEATTGELEGFTCYRCKLPYNTHFIPALKLCATAGIRVDATPSLETNRFCASYITAEGEQAHEFIGWMNGEEVVYKVPCDTVQVDGLYYRETGFPAAFAGTFFCDDTQLDMLWGKAQRTLYVTMRDNFMDCPCRERAQWPGDMVVQFGQIPYCLGREADLLAKKGLRETLRWQRENGELYGPVPEGNWRIELPSQMLAVISPYGIWTYYMNTADLDTLAELYPFAKRYLEIWEFQESGLVKYRPDTKNSIPEIVDGVGIGTWDWLDWGERIDAEPALNAWFVLAAQGVRKIAEELGFDADACIIRQREEQVLSAIREAFWDDNMGGYTSGGFGFDADDRVQALMILCGAADASQYPKLKRILERVEQACPFMEKYVLEALFKMDEQELAMNRMKRRYASMVSNMDSTLWERWPEWHDGGESTVNHSWSGGPLTLLSGQVAGIRPLEPGWKKILVQPKPCGLKEIQAVVQIPQGKLELSIELEVEEPVLRLSVPPGTEVLLDGMRLGMQENPLVGPGRQEYHLNRKPQETLCSTT
ncbi:MAG: alpha-L-rhamnosidase C-terminal domain-containing protein [Verrucomicrobiota bacterium]